MTVTPRHTAYHEAGHAVVAAALGFTVNTITIEANEAEGTLGVASIAYSHFHPSAHRHISRELRAEYRDCIMHMLAGEIAESIAMGDQYDPECSSADREEAADFAQYLSRNPERYLADCRRDARDLVRKHWGAIEIVAQALLGRGTLTGGDFVAIVTVAQE